MHVSTIGIVAIMAGVATAKTCYDMTVQVPVTARNGVFDKISTPQTNLDATAFALHASTQAANVTADALSGYATIAGMYDISAQYCMPETGGDRPHVLQILTHGMGFDKTWVMPIISTIAYSDTIDLAIGTCPMRTTTTPTSTRLCLGAITL
jgi:hypothetical protein